MIKELFTDLKYTFTQEGLDTLIVFITNRCNLKCYFCFYADSLNTSKDLPFSAYEKMSDSIPNLRSLLISGGEPFLRDDIADLLLLFTRKCGVRFINIPTNGSFTKNMMERAQSFLEREKNAFLTISFSLDGFKETHDKVRGQDGSYDKAIVSMQELMKLKPKYPNLRVQISTVACEENIDQLESFVDHVKDNYPIDYHNVEIVRVGQPTIDSVPNIREIAKKFVKICNKVSMYYLYERKDNAVYPFFSQKLSRAITRALDLSRMTIDQQLIQNNKSWPVGCLAGKTIAVVDANGDFRACELRAPQLNLKDYDYNISKALETVQLKKEIQQIEKGKCFCTHGCFIAASQRRFPSTFLYRWWGLLFKDATGRGVTHGRLN